MVEKTPLCNNQLVNANDFSEKFTFKRKKSIIRFEDDTTVDFELLLNNGLIKKTKNVGLKVLGNGELNKKLVVKANKFSESAIEKIQNAGGKVEVL